MHAVLAAMMKREESHLKKHSGYFPPRALFCSDRFMVRSKQDGTRFKSNRMVIKCGRTGTETNVNALNYIIWETLNSDSVKVNTLLVWYYLAKSFDYYDCISYKATGG